MKIARLSLDQGPRFAALDEETGTYLVLSDDPLFGKIEATGQRVSAADAHLVAPMIPRSKVVGFSGTFETDGGEAGSLTDLTMFLKPNTSVIGPDDPIVLPNWARVVRHGPELAVVIGRACKDVAVSRVKDVVFGYTVANDVTAVAGDSVRSKSFDTSCPIGPVIETDLDVADLRLESKVDGEVRREGSTADLAFSVAELVAYASSVFTLLPGDIILTGAPAVVGEGGSDEAGVGEAGAGAGAGAGGAGVGAIEAGQDVEVSCEGIGSFRNPVLRRG
ncbi:MAG: fumarylacetoacetate hydrolase family protein [Ancrocorticia sp.]